MAENMMNNAHKSSNEASRRNWSNTFPRCAKCGGPAQVFQRGAWVSCPCPVDGLELGASDAPNGKA